MSKLKANDSKRYYMELEELESFSPKVEKIHRKKKRWEDRKEDRRSQDEEEQRD